MIIHNVYLRILLSALFVYRASILFSRDIGPYEIFKKIRLFFGKKSRNNKNSIFYQFAELISCPYCLGIWLSAFSLLFFFIESKLFDYIIILFSISGIQTFLLSIWSNSDYG